MSRGDFHPDCGSNGNLEMVMQNAPDFVVQTILRNWSKGEKVLDIGCGPCYLREVFKDDYIGCDVNDEPYGKIERKVDLICSAEDLKLPDESVDHVVIKSALFLFHDIDKALSEAKRVLKKGGVLYLFDYNKRTQMVLAKKDGVESYPCWTQWGLKRRVRKLGYSKAQILAAKPSQPATVIRILRSIYSELFGTWAIVEARKSEF